MTPITGTKVLKFGGSVLRNENDLPRVVQEIYRHWRHGEQVLAVVSAFYGKTDDLIRQTRAYSEEPDPGVLAALLLTGEATSAAMLALALDRAGIPVKLLSPEQAGIKTCGDPIDAVPVEANTDRIRAELEKAVVIVSGFVGTTNYGDLTLLGRGGTDLTALFLAERLNAQCRLVKDVEGLYECDPAVCEVRPRKYIRANFQTALDVGGRLVQPKAVHFARERNLEFEIAGFRSRSETRIGNFEDEFDSNSERHSRPIRVALLGCGTVGGGVFKRLTAPSEQFVVTGVANLSPEKALAAGIGSALRVADARELIERECDVVIELIGGLEPAYSLIKRALTLGRQVITANKALLAEHAGELEELARQKGVAFRYSASVGGVLPALEAVARAAALDSPHAVKGIVNGTCNFICDQLTEGTDFATAVLLAEKAGYTEADPSLDLDGTDAAQKLVLLANATFGIRLPITDVNRVGLDTIDASTINEARKRGSTIRLVAECRRTLHGITASVKPVEVPNSHPFAQTKGADNCLLIESANGKRKWFRGRGAGRYATTESVMADLFDLHNEFVPSHTNGHAKVQFQEVVA